MSWSGTVQIEVISATGIPAADLNGKSDPYVVVKFGPRTLKTRSISKTLNPVWNQSLHFLYVMIL